MGLNLLELDLGGDRAEGNPKLLLVFWGGLGREVEQERGQKGGIDWRAELKLSR